MEANMSNLSSSTAISTFDFRENGKSSANGSLENPTILTDRLGGNRLQANPSFVPEFVKTYHKQT